MDPRILKRLKARKFLTVLSHIIRGMLLVTTLVSLVTLFIWVNRPDLIDSLEKWTRDGYGKKFIMQNQKADSLITKNQLDEAYSILSNNLKDMGKVNKLDTLNMPYSECLYKLHYLSMLTGNKALSLQVTQMLVDFDSNDVNNLIDHSRALADTGNYSEAEPYLLRANKLSPALRAPAEQLMVYYARTNRKKEARDILDNYQNANRHLLIKLLLISAKANGGKSELSFTGHPVSGKPQILRLKVPEGTDGSLPRNSKLMIIFSDDPLLYIKLGALTAKTNGGTFKIEPTDIEFESPGTRKAVDGKFLLEGQHPSITFNLPDKLFNKILKELDVEVEFKPALSPLMLSMEKELQ